MKLPKRFALSTLLLLMLVVALVFGYAQWRRQWLAQQVSELQSVSHSDIVLSEDWFWPTVSSQVTVMLFEGQDGSFILPPPNFGMGNNVAMSGGKHYTRKEAEEYFAALQKKLRTIGVQNAKFAFSSPNLGMTFIEVAE